jgi:poly(3-hydroxybutyrate) depolymerase
MRIPSLLSFAVLAGVSTASASGCGKNIPSRIPKSGETKGLHLPGTDREYLLSIPANYDINKPTPLYFSFHGATRNMYEEESLSQFSDPEFSPNGIAIYPNSKNGYWLLQPQRRYLAPERSGLHQRPLDSYGREALH